MATGGDGSAGVLTPQERLLERLGEPATVDSLNRLLDRLDVIVFSVEAFEGFLRRAEVVADSVAQGMGELRHMVGEEGSGELMAKVPQLLRTGGRMADLAARPEVSRLLDSGLLEKLGDPKTIQALSSLLGNVEVIAFLLDSLDGFLRRSDAVIESVAEGMSDLKTAIPDLDPERVRRIISELPGLVEAGEVLAEAGMFDRQTVEVLVRIGRTVAASYQDFLAHPAKPVGLFELYRSLKDPEIQATVRLVLYVAKSYGRGLGG
ncbi:MAG: DUF1641 domain-containing protein [Acidobacteriota bacterium]